MKLTQEISIALLVAAFICIFLNVFYNILAVNYLSAVFLLLSLYLYKNITPTIFAFIFASSTMLLLFSISPFMLAALFPLVGLLFSGSNRNNVELKPLIRYALLITLYLFYLIYCVTNQGGYESETGSASHNYLTVLVLYAIIAELLYFGAPSCLYIPLVLVSFIFLGNRSGMYLLAVFIKNKTLLFLFIAVGGLFSGITYGLIPSPPGMEALFEIGGILYRSSKEIRGDVIGQFFNSFNFANLAYDNWDFYGVPRTADSVDGFYDLHNSFLTIVVRDSYLGLFKVFLWSVQILFLPLGTFIGITMRAFNDTFFMGGIQDLLVYALIGRSINKYRLKQRLIS